MLATQIDRPSYEKFLAKFPSIKLNETVFFLTRHLNASSLLDLRRNYTLLNPAETFYYLCHEDSSKLFYEYDLYHMEDGHIIKHVKKNYDRYAILSLRRSEYDLLLNATHNDNNRYFYLQSFNKRGELIAEMSANKVVFENIDSNACFQFLLLEGEDVDVFAFTDNQNASKPVKTLVQVQHYKTDAFGRFNFRSVDSLYLRESINR